MKLLKLTMCSFLLAMNLFAGKTASESSSSSCSSSTSRPTSTTEFSVATAADILQAYQNATAETVSDVIHNFSPSKILFEAHYTLCVEKKNITDSTKKDLLESATLAYVVLLRSVNNTPILLEITSKRLLGIIEVLKSSKTFEKQLNGKLKNLFKNNFSSDKKFRNTTPSQMISAVGGEEKVEKAVRQVKASLIAYKRFSPECSEDNFSALYFVGKQSPTQNDDLQQLCALWGCMFAFADIKNHLFDHSDEFDPAELKKSFSALVYGQDSFERSNYASFCHQAGEKEQALKWARISTREGSPQGISLVKAIESNLKLDLVITPDSHVLATAEAKYMEAIADIEKLDVETPLDERKRVAKLLREAAEGGSQGAKEFLPSLLYLANDFEACYEWGLKLYQEKANQEHIVTAGKAAYSLGHYMNALSCFQKYKGKEIETLVLQEMIATCYFVAKNFVEMRRHLDLPVIRKTSKAAALNLYAHIDCGESAEALRAFELLEREFSDQADVLFGASLALGTYYLRASDYQTALPYLQKAVHLKQTRESLFYLGITAYFLRDFEKAQTCLLQAKEYTHQNVNIIRIDDFRAVGFLDQIHLYLSLIFMNFQDFDKALHHAKKAYSMGIKRCSFNIAAICVLQQKNQQAEQYFKMAIAHNIEGASVEYALFLDKLRREREALAILELLEIAEEESDDSSESDDCSKEAIATFKPYVAPQPKHKMDDNNDLHSYVEAKDSKRYKRSLEKAQREAERLKEKPAHFSENETTISYQNLNITLAFSKLQGEIGEYELRIQELLSAFANGIRAGHFETLSGYQKRCSMRITKGDRLVFDIIEGSITKPKAIVIVSAKGHYKNLTDTEFTAPTEIKVEWSEE